MPSTLDLEFTLNYNANGILLPSLYQTSVKHLRSGQCTCTGGTKGEQDEVPGAVRVADRPNRVSVGLY